MSRRVDPFVYWPQHASAIEGLGGDSLSPDPRYCFCTAYVPVKAGPASFRLTIRQVRASFGRLALHIHGLRPEAPENISLVTATRLEVATEDRADVEAAVRFAAIRGVHYAFYGYFVEDSDIDATDLEVSIEESEGDEEDYVQPPQSVLAWAFGPKEVRPANALIHVIAPHLSTPVSQDCTFSQIEENTWGDCRQDARGTRVIDRDQPDTLQNDWAEAVAIAALDAYGVGRLGLEAQVLGDVSPRFEATLVERLYMVQKPDVRAIPTASSPHFADLVLWPRGLWAEPDPERRWAIVHGWLGRLKIGGLGAITVRYRPDADPISSLDFSSGPEITRNEIGQWVLRLIGEGYAVAPLAFSDPDELVLDAHGLARFALIVQRH